MCQCRVLRPRSVPLAASSKHLEEFSKDAKVRHLSADSSARQRLVCTAAPLGKRRCCFCSSMSWQDDFLSVEGDTKEASGSGGPDRRWILVVPPWHSTNCPQALF